MAAPSSRSYGGRLPTAKLAASSSTSSPISWSPGTLTRMPSSMRTSGPRWRRRWLERAGISSPNSSSGGGRDSAQAPGGVDRRGVHGQQGEHLEEVVLEDVADRARLLVEGAPALDAEVLGHGDLHLADVAGVPDRLQQGVGEAQVEDVLDRLLAQEVVHPEDAVLGQVAVQDLVQLPGRGQVAAERLLHDHPGRVEAAGGGQALGHGGEHARRDGQVVQRPAGGPPQPPWGAAGGCWLPGGGLECGPAARTAWETLPLGPALAPGVVLDA